MKNRMPTRKSLGKVSNFLKGLIRKKQGVTSNRTAARDHLGSQAPHSTKIAKCSLGSSAIWRTGKYDEGFGRKGRL